MRKLLIISIFLLGCSEGSTDSETTSVSEGGEVVQETTFQLCNQSIEATNNAGSEGESNDAESREDQEACETVNVATDGSYVFNIQNVEILSFDEVDEVVRLAKEDGCVSSATYDICTGADVFYVDCASTSLLGRDVHFCLR